MAKRILVPLDRTAESETILPLVADLARGAGAFVRLLHVAAPPSNVSVDGRVVSYADQEMAHLEAESLDYLGSAELLLEGVSVDSVVRFGDPLEEIRGEATTFEADLIAVSRAPRRGLRRLHVRGVANRLLGRATQPVLLLRST